MHDVSKMVTTDTSLRDHSLPFWVLHIEIEKTPIRRSIREAMFAALLWTESTGSDNLILVMEALS